ncbi:MAG: DUF167 domain-containing protein [Phycisphaeraceae bacterium]|nr:MAG: DUF167 domain-containing protein [Phycisphaeraceae bacterium]
MSAAFVSDDGAGGALIRVKAVPGARSDEISGVLGDRLKVRISAPPEGGKANRAIAKLLARSLGVKPRDVELVAGPSSAEKTFRVAGAEAERVENALSGSS